MNDKSRLWSRGSFLRQQPLQTTAFHRVENSRVSKASFISLASRGYKEIRKIGREMHFSPLASKLLWQQKPIFTPNIFNEVGGGEYIMARLSITWLYLWLVKSLSKIDMMRVVRRPRFWFYMRPSKNYILRQSLMRS